MHEKSLINKIYKKLHHLLEYFLLKVVLNLKKKTMYNYPFN